MKPAQSIGQADTPIPFATLRETDPRGGYSVGDPAYLRVRVAYFVRENGVDVAVVSPIERDGGECTCPERREVYFVPLKHLVQAETVKQEMQG